MQNDSVHSGASHGREARACTGLTLTLAATGPSSSQAKESPAAEERQRHARELRKRWEWSEGGCSVQLVVSDAARGYCTVVVWISIPDMSAMSDALC